MNFCSWLFYIMLLNYGYFTFFCTLLHSLAWQWIMLHNISNTSGLYFFSAYIWKLFFVEMGYPMIQFWTHQSTFENYNIPFACILHIFIWLWLWKEYYQLAISMMMLGQASDWVVWPGHWLQHYSLAILSTSCSLRLQDGQSLIYALQSCQDIPYTSVSCDTADSHKKINTVTTGVKKQIWFFWFF